MKNEPQFMLDWRLKAFAQWQKMRIAGLGKAQTSIPIDYQAISYYSAPKKDPNAPKSLDEVDPEAAGNVRQARYPAARARPMLAGVAVDAVFDSVSGHHDVQGQAGRGRGDFLLVFGGRAGPPRLG